MKIEFNDEKRLKTLQERGVDFKDAPAILSDEERITFEDLRFDYGEKRFITYGHLNGRLMCVIWTKRNDAVRVISMRKANEREQSKFAMVER